jgi:hypothetical protein
MSSSYTKFAGGQTDVVLLAGVRRRHAGDHPALLMGRLLGRQRPRNKETTMNGRDTLLWALGLVVLVLLIVFLVDRVM